MRCSKTIQGFTLIEVLIGLTLLSIMMVLLFTSLKICADSWEKGETKIAEVNEISVVYNFFQRHLSAARPLWDDFSGEERTFSFQGKSQSLQFVSAFPASVGKSGPQLISLFLQEEDQERVIKVVLTPFFPLADGNEWNKEEVTLVSGVSEFKLTYFGAEDGASEGVWMDEWLVKQVQPRLVKIKIELENGIFWPEMVIGIQSVGSLNNSDGDMLSQSEEEQQQ
ncbi:MAG: prepilin-type N-terminal cleavage/methylation domain-containing protein [Methylococcaceae bacterium]|nr:prepilin-type N-terminal cleavage/methylation domain-containing protein [Methylococcaceae bacterium]